MSNDLLNNYGVGRQIYMLVQVLDILCYDIAGLEVAYTLLSYQLREKPYGCNICEFGQNSSSVPFCTSILITALWLTMLKGHCNPMVKANLYEIHNCHTYGYN